LHPHSLLGLYFIVNNPVVPDLRDALAKREGVSLKRDIWKNGLFIWVI
jgi:hypothetical protein